MFRLKAFLSVLLAAAILVIAVSCRPGAQKKPAPTRYDREPEISLFVNDTGQKKKIKLEDYVAGVVAAEMEPTWPVNALAAQAILARTFTMENIQAGRVKKLHGTDASTSVEEFQAYDPSRINDNVRKAVQMTRGEVITYNGQYIKAWFSACDGGISSSAKEGLAYTKTPTPYVKANVRDNCLSITTAENKQWTARVPLARVRAAVQKITGKDPGNISQAAIARKGPSGRAETIRLGSVTVGGPALRLALGSEVMRSTLLENIAVQGDQLVMTGRGFGHGVGMCQWGAHLMARQGQSPEEIVKFYYQNVRIDKLYP
ncbi:MAG: SpoIID/LytB domain-containing protein [Desulfurispora sp.]|uniref:SpoIID/LytB domain-containing protein n=1 Tax=Desulfurispora sp. TaxID=3014275 RepID=UPI00404A99C3